MPLLRCDKCQTPLPGAAVNTLTPIACPACGTSLIVQVFPAFLRPGARGRVSVTLGSAEAAGGFSPPRK